MSMRVHGATGSHLAHVVNYSEKRQAAQHLLESNTNMQSNKSPQDMEPTRYCLYIHTDLSESHSDMAGRLFTLQLHFHGAAGEC